MVARVIEDGEQVTYLEEVSFWLELQQCIREVDAKFSGVESKKVRQKLRLTAFQSFLEGREQMLSSAILEDLVHERFDNDDPWISGSILQSFQEWEESLSVEKKPLSAKQKKILVAVLAVAIGIAVNFAAGPAIADKMHSLFPPDDKTAIAAPVEEKEEKAPPPPPTAPPETPYASRPENSGDFPPGTAWRIEGEVPPGYFRDATASIFYSSSNNWIFDQESLGVMGSRSESSEATTITVSENEVSEPGTYALASPYEGYKPAFLDVGLGNPYNLVKNSNGTYSVRVYEVTKPTKIRVGWQKDQSLLTDAPTNYQSNWESIIGNVDQAPEEVRQLLNEIKDLPAERKASRITSFVKQYFTYSLDPAHSAYHRAKGESGEFFRRVFARPFGDCDVVNTIMVGLFRAAGLPARMAYGYMNSNDLFDANKGQLDNAERHGWTEWWDGSKWVMADGTPTKVDDYTLSKLKGLNGGLGISEIVNLHSMEELLQMLKISVLLAADWLKDWGVMSAIFGYVLSQLLSWGVLYKKGENAEGRLEEIKRKIYGMKGSNYDDFERYKVFRYIENRVDPQSKKLIWRENTFAENLTGFVKGVTILPRYLHAEKKKRRIKEIEERIPAVREKHLDQQSDFSLIVAALFNAQEDREALVTHIIHENDESGIMMGDFFNSFLSHCQKELRIHFAPPEARAMNDHSFIKKLMAEAQTKEDFLNTVVGAFYRGYKIKKSPNESKKKTLQEFTEMFIDDFVKLADLWDMDAHTKDVAAKRAEHMKTLGEL